MRSKINSKFKKAFKNFDKRDIIKILENHHPQFKGRVVYNVKKMRDEWFALTNKGWEPFIPRWCWEIEIEKYCLYTLCREIVAPQIFKLKIRSIGKKCPITGELLSPRNIEIHHHKLSFEKIFYEFLRREGLSLEDDFYVEWKWWGLPYQTPLMPNLICVRKPLPVVLKRFALFHREHAILLPVSKRGHRIIHSQINNVKRNSRN